MRPAVENENHSAEAGAPANADPFERAAREIVRWGLAAPAIFLVESVKPLEGVASHLVRVFSPLAGLFAPATRIESIAAALEGRTGLEKFLREIEKCAASEPGRPERSP
jgi:hypothetical protein